MSYKRLIIMTMILGILLALPATVWASKGTFRARLSTGAELHQVVGSSARGTAVFSRSPMGFSFILFVRNLSGPVSGAHIHGPASESENAGILVTLCGSPGPAVVANCEVVNGELNISGEFNNNLIAADKDEFVEWLESGQLYVNVHTAQNPMGEARGQIIPQ